MGSGEGNAPYRNLPGVCMEVFGGEVRRGAHEGVSGRRPVAVQAVGRRVRARWPTRLPCARRAACHVLVVVDPRTDVLPFAEHGAGPAVGPRACPVGWSDNGGRPGHACTIREGRRAPRLRRAVRGALIFYKGGIGNMRNKAAQQGNTQARRFVLGGVTDTRTAAGYGEPDYEKLNTRRLIVSAFVRSKRPGWL